MTTHYLILCLFLAILSGCSSVDTVKPIEIIAADPQRELFGTNHEPYRKSVNCSNLVIASDEFRSRVIAANFEQTTDTSWQVLAKIEAAKPMQIKPIWPKNRWSSMTATTFKGDYTVYLNARKSRQVPAMVGSICHEGLGHLQGWTHRGNNPKGNENSQPYKIGTICSEMAQKICQ